MGKGLDPDKAQKLRTGYFQNLSNEQNAEQAGCSVGSAFNHTKELENEIQEHGLMPILEKYGLVEAKNTAILGQSLKIHQTTPAECYRSIPLTRRLAAIGVPTESMEVVIGQVFAACPPERAREFGAAILDYANERQQNQNLTILQARTEYNNLTARCEQLSERERTLTPAVASLESQRTQLVNERDRLLAEQKRLSDQLANEGQTDQTLKQYISDKAYLKGINVDIMNVQRARQFFGEMERHGYNPSRVALLLTNNPALYAAASALGQEVKDLVRKKIKLTNKISELEAKRLEAERRAADGEKDAEARIAAANKRVDEKLAEEKTTLMDIEDEKKFRAELKEAGLE